MTPDEVAEFVEEAYPIDSVTEYGSVLKVNRRVEIRQYRPIVRGVKGELTYLSKRSRDYLAFVMNATPVKFHSMMVCTYGKNYPRDGRRVKADLNKILNWVRRRLGGEYLWFLEFQRRGAPHFHILLEYAEVSADIRYDFGQAWANIVCDAGVYPYCDIATRSSRTIHTDISRVHRHPKQWARSRKPDGLVGYVTKYATKTHQKDVPADYGNVGRFFGWSRPVRDQIKAGYTVRISNNEIRWALREMNHRVADYHIVPKYIFGVGLK